jgi:hypothetical protein
MFGFKVEFYDSDDLREWCIEEGWNIENEIALLNGYDLWDELFDYIESVNCYTNYMDSETELNDFIRFELEEVDWFALYIEMNNFKEEENE